MTTRDTLIQMFSTAAAILDIKGENKFKAVAFQKVARLLEDPSIDLETAHNENRLAKIQGIGESSAKMIADVMTTGKSADFQELYQSIPPGLLDMLKIPGTGPKTVALLWKERNITSVEQLGKAIDDGQLAGIKGLGEKKIAGMKEGIAMLATAGLRRGIGDVLATALAFKSALASDPRVLRVELAGSLRRGKETIGDLDLIASPKNPKDAEAIIAFFTQLPSVQKVLGSGITKGSILTTDNLQIDLRVVPDVHFGAALMYFTGSKEHNVRVRSLAQEKGLTLNEWGLFDEAEWDKSTRTPGEAPTLKPVASQTEADVFSKLGMHFVEPELREDRGEVAAAMSKKLPLLVTRKDIQGELHCHTTASDGVNSILDMAHAAKELGYHYIAITDHSKSQPIANGLTAQRLLKHIADIRKAQEQIKGIMILAGSEVDILADGSLDYDDAILAELDWVVASPHNALKPDAETANARLLCAIENPFVNVIGHPTGRLINARNGLPIDISKIAAACKASGTALEINAGWPRLDLNDAMARVAIDVGCVLTIDTDAHSCAGLSEIDLGITTARRAWVTPGKVLNAQPLETVLKWVKAKRR
jgi:DNA polymerase (family X)